MSKKLGRFKAPKDVRMGVVGYGGSFNMGRRHFQEAQQAGMTPVAVAEIDPARREVAKTDFPGIETYKSLGAMLKESDINLVTIITPHNTHAKLATQALRAGKHVVCEKPLAITTAECDRMIDLAQKKNLVVSTYHNRHWDGCILEAVRQIRAGAIGEVVRIEAHGCGYRQPGQTWRHSKSISGGILYDWGVHLLEYSLQLIDSEIVEVGGFSRTGFWANKSVWKHDTNEDEAFAVVRFANGSWLTLCMSSIDSNPKPGQLEITGTKGSYVFEGQTWQINRHQDGVQITTRGKNPESESWRFYQNLCDHLTKGSKLVINGQWARRPIHILDLAGRSARSGKTLRARYQ